MMKIIIKRKSLALYDPYSKESLYKFHKDKMDNEPFNYKYLNGDIVPIDLLKEGRVIRERP